MAFILRKEGCSAEYYHGKLPEQSKKLAQAAWSAGKSRIMCATSAFGMGIDKSDVRLIVHISMPPSLDAYAQEIGRAGRDGLESTAVVFLDLRDRFKWLTLLQAERECEREELKAQLYDAYEYAIDRVSCRNLCLLTYFGESATGRNCDQLGILPCSNCTSSSNVGRDQECVFDFAPLAKAVRLMLSQMTDAPSHTQLVAFLVGENNAVNKRRRLTENPLRGCMQEIAKEIVQEFVLKLVINGWTLESASYNEVRHYYDSKIAASLTTPDETTFQFLSIELDANAYEKVLVAAETYMALLALSYESAEEQSETERSDSLTPISFQYPESQTSAEAEPQTSAEAEPQTSTEAEPQTSAEAEPQTSTEAEPQTSAEAESLTLEAESDFSEQLEPETSTTLANKRTKWNWEQHKTFSILKKYRGIDYARQRSMYTAWTSTQRKRVDGRSLTSNTSFEVSLPPSIEQQPSNVSSPVSDSRSAVLTASRPAAGFNFNCNGVHQLCEGLAPCLYKMPQPLIRHRLPEHCTCTISDSERRRLQNNVRHTWRRGLRPCVPNGVHVWTQTMKDAARQLYG